MNEMPPDRIEMLGSHWTEVYNGTRYATRPFNHSSMHPAATTNKAAGAIAYLREMQATLARELDSNHISYVYHSHTRGRCSHFIR